MFTEEHEKLSTEALSTLTGKRLVDGYTSGKREMMRIDTSIFALNNLSNQMNKELKSRLTNIWGWIVGFKNFASTGESDLPTDVILGYEFALENKDAFESWKSFKESQEADNMSN